jgi:hypothetical protein
VPQFIFEQAVAQGCGGATTIIICQPRRIAAVGLATRVAAGAPAGTGCAHVRMRMCVPCTTPPCARGCHVLARL